MPRAPRGKRVHDPSVGSFVVVNRAPRGQPDPSSAVRIGGKCTSLSRSDGPEPGCITITDLGR